MKVLKSIEAKLPSYKHIMLGKNEHGLLNSWRLTLLGLWYLPSTLWEAVRGSLINLCVWSMGLVTGVLLWALAQVLLVLFGLCGFVHRTDE